MRAAWIISAPHHGFGRGFKVGREEIMGMLAAVEAWYERNHDEEREIRAGWMQRIARRLQPVESVETDGGTPDRPSLSVRWDPEKIPLSGVEMEKLLWDGNPRIAVSGAGSFLPFPPNLEPDIRINPSQMAEWEVDLVADRIFELLSQPPRMERASDPPAFDVDGQWDLEMIFSAGREIQNLAIEQNGSKLIGTQTASYAPRDISGTIHGEQVEFLSSYTHGGVRLNFTFTGRVNAESMEGTVCMGEYGTARWRATRRGYQPPGSPGASS